MKAHQDPTIRDCPAASLAIGFSMIHKSSFLMFCLHSQKTHTSLAAKTNKLGDNPSSWCPTSSPLGWWQESVSSPLVSLLKGLGLGNKSLPLSSPVKRKQLGKQHLFTCYNMGDKSI